MPPTTKTKFYVKNFGAFHLLILLSGVLNLSFCISSKVSAFIACKNLFEGEGQPTLTSILNGRLIESKLQKMLSQEVLEQRLDIVFSHQNIIRSSAGVPQVSDEFLVQSKNENRKINDMVWHLGARFQPGDSNSYSIYNIGDSMIIFPKWDDFLFANYVYEFDGTKLKRAIPEAQYFLEQYSRPVLTLYRSMSLEEFKLWSHNDIAKLMFRGNGPRNYQRPVVYFKPDSIWSWTGSNSITARFDIPRSVLLEWAKKNNIGIGMLDRSKKEYEIVLPAEVWNELSLFMTDAVGNPIIP